MLSRDQRRELLGSFLFAIGMVALLSLIPLPGEGGTSSLMGSVGRRVRDGLVGFAGIGSVLVALVPAVAGAGVARWMARERALRLGTLLAGLLLILPAWAAVAGFPSAGGGIGGVTGGLLLDAFGRFGGTLVLLFIAIFFSVATIGWNPIPPLGRVVARTGTVAAKNAALAGESLVRKGGEAVREIRARRTEENGQGNGGSGSGTGAGRPATGGSSANDAWTGGLEEGELFPLPEPESADEAGAEGAGSPKGSRSRGAKGGGREGRDPAPSASPSFRDEMDSLLPDPLSREERKGGRLPPLDLLTEPSYRDRQGMERELDRLGEVLVEKLATFQVESTLAGRTTGPVVTQFEVVPAPGVKVNRIANLEADLALAMKARSIRIVAPIPGKGAVGVEIPNPRAEVVMLREILEAETFERSRASLPLALGRDLAGEPYVADLAKMPHALIAGATGSGKSVCLNTVITSLVYRHTPETLRLLLIDPKMVELSIYSELPHLRHPVVTDPKDAAGVLKWAVLEMERRYALLSANGVRSLTEFNRRVREGIVLRRSELDGPDGPEGDPDRHLYKDGLLPFIVLVVDELADLMMAVQSEVERPLTLLAQKARAIGIHIILATQRPSVNVITGLIKANFPCRIAFRVASKTDSRTILDQNGADALLGNGDMLFLPPGEGEAVRMQGAYIPTEDTDELTRWFTAEKKRLQDEGEPLDFGKEENILEVVRRVEAQEGGGGDSDAIQGDWDELFREAAEVCLQHDQGSTSLLQRRLRIGYGRAARIVDQLHDAGILGPADGSKPREVLISPMELDGFFGGGPATAGDAGIPELLDPDGR